MAATPPNTANSPAIVWQTVAILVLLATQAVLVAMLSAKVFSLAPQAAPPDSQRLEAAAEKIDAALIGLEDRRRSALPEDVAEGSDRERLRDLHERVSRLDDDVEARDAQIRELQGELNEARDKILVLEIAAKRNEERLKSLTDSLRAESEKLAGGKH